MIEVLRKVIQRQLIATEPKIHRPSRQDADDGNDSRDFVFIH